MARALLTKQNFYGLSTTRHREGCGITKDMKAWALSKQSGFTIVEMILVIVIIAVLATITTVSYRGIEQRSRDATRTRDITEVQKALEKYRYDNGIYPSVGTDNTAYALSTLATALVPKYLDAIPTAPSGSPSGTDYQYVRGAASAASYGIRMYYESKPDCQRGVNNTSGATWWSSLAACPSS